MAKVSTLPAAADLTGAEQLPLVQAGASRRTTLDAISERASAPVLAQIRQARAWISGAVTGVRPIAGGYEFSVERIGYLWVEGNAGAPLAAIAALAGPVAVLTGQALIVDFDTGVQNGDGAYVPEVVALASGLQTGWQSRSRYVLAAVDLQNTIFGEYAAPRGATGYDPGALVIIKSAERVDIYSPSTEADRPDAVHFHIVHSVDPLTRVDVWRIERVWRATREGLTSFTDTIPFTDPGETEVAVSEPFAPDHSGGASHGDHRASYVMLLMDGLPLAQGLADGVYFRSSFEMVQDTRLLEARAPAVDLEAAGLEVEQPPIATIQLRHVILPGGVMRLPFGLIFEDMVAVDLAAVGMLKPCLEHAGVPVFTGVVRDGPWAEFDLTGAFDNVPSKGRAVKYFAPALGMACSMELAPGSDWTRESRNLYVEPVGPKGKAYFVWAGIDDGTPYDASGQVIEGEIIYRFEAL